MSGEARDLLARVRARRAEDAAAGTVVAAPTVRQAARLVALMRKGRMSDT